MEGQNVKKMAAFFVCWPALQKKKKVFFCDMSTCSDEHLAAASIWLFTKQDFLWRPPRNKIQALNVGHELSQDLMLWGSCTNHNAPPVTTLAGVAVVGWVVYRAINSGLLCSLNNKCEVNSFRSGQARLIKDPVSIVSVILMRLENWGLKPPGYKCQERWRRS